MEVYCHSFSSWHWMGVSHQTEALAAFTGRKKALVAVELEALYRGYFGDKTDLLLLLRFETQIFQSLA